MNITLTIIFQEMSHINDFIGVVRGLRQVIDAGAKLQQENTKLILNNSSFRQSFQNCSINSLSTLKPNKNAINEAFERAMVVLHGIRQFVTMHNFNNNTNIESVTAMDSQLQEDIEILNKQFNETFDSLKQTQKKIISSTSPAALAEEIMEPKQKVEPMKTISVVKPTEKKEDNLKVNVVPLPNMEPSSSKSVPKPVARKKLKVSVSTFIITFISALFFLNLYTFTKYPVLYIF